MIMSGMKWKPCVSFIPKMVNEVYIADLKCKIDFYQQCTYLTGRNSLKVLSALIAIRFLL